MASIATGPHVAWPSPAAPAAEMPRVPASQEVRPVDPQSVPQLPLAEGAVQQFIVPEGWSGGPDAVFIFAMFPEPAQEVHAFLRRELPLTGWKVRSAADAETGNYGLTVVSPRGHVGLLEISSAPPGIPGLRSQVMGTLREESGAKRGRS